MIPLPAALVADFDAMVACTGLSADTPRFLELAGAPCPDESGKFCLAGSPNGGEYRRECDAIVVQQLSPSPTTDEIQTRIDVVRHEVLHHLVDESGDRKHDHCHPAFVKCDPRPRPRCA